MTTELTEHEIDILEAGCRFGKARIIMCDAFKLTQKLVSFGLLEPCWWHANAFQLTAEGARAIGAKCQVCGLGEPFMVGPTGALARITIYCEDCAEGWRRAREQEKATPIKTRETLCQRVAGWLRS